MWLYAQWVSCVLSVSPSFIPSYLSSLVPFFSPEEKKHTLTRFLKSTNKEQEEEV